MSESQKRGVNQVISESYISANGSVGLEFDNIEPIKNLIERITDDYNVKVVNYLESARARQSQLRFSKLDISTEVQECIDSVNRQNRSLNEFKEQLISYQKKVNETEQNIIDQLSKITLDVDINPPSASVSTSNVTTESIVVKSSSDIAVPEVEKEEESILDKVLDLLCKVGDQLINALLAATEWISSWIEKLDATMKDLGIEINPFKILDDILNEAIKLNTTVVETLQLNSFNLFGNVIDILNGFQDLRDTVCEAIYDLEIPILSDFVGAYAGLPIDGESSFITILGAYARGIWVDGVEGTAEAILQIGADPLGAVEGITHILAYPKESIDAIKEGVMAFVNDKVVNGTPEDRAAVAGQVVFEAFTWLIGIGEAKAAKTAKVSKVEGVSKVLDDSMDEIVKGSSKTVDDIIESSVTHIKSAENSADILRIVNKLNENQLKAVCSKLDDADLEKVVRELNETQIDYLLKTCNSDLEAKINKIYEGGSSSVDDIIESVENGDIPLANNLQKGNYGEMKMDQYYESQGYERISVDKVTDLNSPSHQGIDGVYYNPDGHPPYIIAEAKYGSSKLGNTRDGMQMSDTWINGSDRLVNAVGKDAADDILLEGYGKTLVNVSPDGTISIKNLE